MHQRNRSYWTRTVSTAVLGALALLAVACSGDTEQVTDPGDTGVESTEESTYNDADITFLQGMIPHHEQAVEMSELVPERTERTELEQLAEDIIASQEAEIAQMEQMLDDAGASTPDDMDMDMEGMDHGGMSGMMTDEQMGRLVDLNGVEFDLMFLDMMIEHHEGAIESAEQLLDEGQNPQARELAEGIIPEQEAEVEQMTTWRQEWAPGTS